MVTKNNYFTYFIFFCSFTLLVCGEKNILPNLTNKEPEPVFLAPWSRSRCRSRSKKNTKSRSRSCLGKKIRSRSRLKKSQNPKPLEKKSQEPEPLKNLPAPSPALRTYEQKIFFFYTFPKGISIYCLFNQGILDEPDCLKENSLKIWNFSRNRTEQ